MTWNARPPTKISLLDDMWMVTKAWNNVTETTVCNCFKSDLNLNEPKEEEDLHNPVPQDTNIPELVKHMGPQDMEFEEFVTFHSNVVICRALTKNVILLSVSADPNTGAELAEEGIEEEEDENNQLNHTVKDYHVALNVLKNVFFFF